MIVVSNTSPLTNLAVIGQLELLHRLYGRVVIAQGVWEELNAGGRSWPGRDEVAQADWIERRHAQDQFLVGALERDLDRGEAETITLALESKADLVLLDEREGLRAARRLGLHVIGVIGILLDAKARGEVKSVRSHLDALRRVAGFYLTDVVYDHALRVAGEGDAQRGAE
jgi:predicted nucleic acid-binding protein